MIDFSVTEAQKRLAACFNARGRRLYIVGGCVRNSLLGLPVSDVDICSSMRLEQVETLCREEGFSARAKGAAFGTLDITVEGETFEYACFRSEVYACGGAHRPVRVVYSDSLEVDAFRRDFTINALYLDILSGELIDPTGGLPDLDARRIRATSADPGLIMGDDALRILRMARFAGELGFTVDAQTISAARTHASGLAAISAERIRSELDKLLVCDARYSAGEKSLLYALNSLYECGALRIVLPELAVCAGVAQRREYHAYDVLNHSFHATASAPPELVLRLTVLLHDVAKPVCLEERGTMHGHDVRGAQIANDILSRLKYSNAIREEAVKLVRHHMFDLNGEAKEKTLRKHFVQLGYDASVRLCLVREADVHGSGIIAGEVETAARWRRVLERMKEEGAPFAENELDCTGLEIAGWLDIAPGPAIGEIKRKLLLHCACRPRDNTNERLKRLSRDIYTGGMTNA